MRGCNPGFVVTSDGVVVIDTPQLPASAVRMRKEAEKHGQIKYLINTEHHVDHIFGNYFFQGAGTVISHAEVLKEFMVVYPQINPYEYAREAVPTDDPQDEALFPDKETYFANMNAPTVTFRGDTTLHMGDTTLELICTPGHTQGQIAVHIPERKVLFSADTIFHGVQTWHYASNIEQWISSLKKLKTLDMDTIVPGHGPVCDKSQIDVQISFLHEWLFEVSACVAKGMSEEECLKHINLRDRFPVDIGQEYMLDHVIKNNVSSLYRKFLENA
ncbi:MBL fold metallo-hydrolase [Rhodobacteraceae bacterium Araon29]